MVAFMKRRSAVLHALVLLTASSVVSGCQNSTGTDGDPSLVERDGTMVVSRPEPEVRRAIYRSEIGFAPDSADLMPVAQQDIDTFLGDVGVADGDQFMIVGPEAATQVSERQRQMVASYLALKGVTVSRLPADAAYVPAANDTVSLILRRQTVVLPACPDWTSTPNQNFTNRPQRNFGCATAANFGMMVASPSDLVSGRGLGPVEGTVSAKSIDRYRRDKTKQLIRDSGSSDVFPAAESGSSGGAEK